MALAALALVGCSEAVIGDAPGGDDELGGGPDATPEVPPPPGDPADAAPPGPGQPDASPYQDYAPSNIPADLLTAGTEPLLAPPGMGAITIDTDTGTIRQGGVGMDLRPAGVVFTVVGQAPGAPELAVLSASDINIGNGVVVTVRGSRGLVLASAGDAVVNGIIVATGGGPDFVNAGPGGFPGALTRAAVLNGSGPGGGQTTLLDDDFEGDTGGGGAGHGAAGGSGGPRGDNPGGAGGAVYGLPALRPLLGGSGGSAGGADQDGSGPGGGGGGAVQISARGVVRVGPNGGINCGGGGGGGGLTDDAGGGGGSGGSILLEGPVLEIAGTLAANGGGGGAGADQDDTGAPGQNGLLGAVPAPGGAGTGEGESGGAGGALTDPRGQLGGAALGIENVSDNGGGGGGAAGRIHLRGSSLSVNGTVSPAHGTSAL